MNEIPKPKSHIPNLILIGYRGTGKTTVGRIVANRLGWAFVDADDEVERRAGKTIAAIFADDGEAAFRDLEQEIVAQLCRRERHVLSLGGGAILRGDNRDAIRDGGMTVWLTASPETIHQRLTADAATRARRPSLTALAPLAEIEQVLKEREPLYRECAVCEIDTEAVSLEAVAEKILARLE